DQVAPAVEAQVARELAAANFRLLEWKELSDVDSHSFLLSRRSAVGSRVKDSSLLLTAFCRLATGYSFGDPELRASATRVRSRLSLVSLDWFLSDDLEPCLLLAAAIA